MDELTARALLARSPGIAARHVRSLLALAAGDLTRIDELAASSQVELPPRARVLLQNPPLTAVTADLEWLRDHHHEGARLLLCTDREFPPRLLSLAGCPGTLYVLGSAAVLSGPQLAIVGTRRPTPPGQHTAAQWTKQLVRAGLAITSGLAEGIDAICHEAALEHGGTTIAVCATGLDEVYPRSHRRLAQRIREQGALVSEFPPGSAPRAVHFARRNRLISGLAEATLVIEAAPGSGSLVTARHARRQGRPLLAVPGSIYSAQSAGCHELIRGGATCVTSVAEVLLPLGIPLAEQRVISQTELPPALPGLDKGLEMLLDAVGFEPAGVDALAARTGLAGEAITSMLMLLELEGRIAPYPGGRFGRIP